MASTFYVRRAPAILAIAGIALTLTGCFESNTNTSAAAPQSAAPQSASMAGFRMAAPQMDNGGFKIIRPCSTTTPWFAAPTDMNSFFFESNPEEEAKKKAAEDKFVANIKRGKCPRLKDGWGDFGDCLATKWDGFEDYEWHCPWESMMLMSNKDYGGCGTIRIDCNQTKYNRILELYERHMVPDNPPIEGNVDTVKYAHCCVTHQCKAGPTCEDAPWNNEKQEEAWKNFKKFGGKDPCGPGGCERLYENGILKHLQFKAHAHIIFGAAAVAGLLGAVLLLLGFRMRAASQRTSSLDPNQYERTDMQSDLEDSQE